LQPGGIAVLDGLVVPKIPECAPSFGLPSASAELPVDLESLLQSLAGRFGLVECCVQEPDAVGVRAHEANQRAVDRARVSHGKQVIEKALAQLVVARRDRGGGHLADKDRPQVRAVRAPVVKCEHSVELAPRSVQVASAGVNPAATACA
jgi:hypothetical protein